MTKMRWAGSVNIKVVASGVSHSHKTVPKRSVPVCALGLLAVLILVAGRAECWPPNNRVPPMGWEPWYIDYCGNAYQWDATYYKKLADFFVTSGLRDLGYKYLTVECGDHYRDKQGHIQPNLTKFPQGFKAITDYIHKKGLKVRAYTDAGKGKCCCFVGSGSFGHYQDDARSWAKFGFDGVKVDWCGGRSEHLVPKTQYLELADAIKKLGRPFCIEICSSGQGAPWRWGRNAGTFWRTDLDLDPGGDSIFKHEVWKNLMRNLDANDHPDPKYVGPGKGWNYPGILLVGLPGVLNETEERTQFSMWAIVASPLFLGNDVFHMPGYARKIVMNREVIAIDQDPLGIQGDVVKEYDKGKLQVWAKPLKDGSKAVALLNRDAAPQRITVTWNDIGISGEWLVRDLWEHVDKGKFTSQYSAEVPSHGAVMLKISPLRKN